MQYSIGSILPGVSIETANDDAVTKFKALAHPVRLGIVRRLAATPEICACDFTDYFDLSQPSVSAHLRTLREAGILRVRRDGNTLCYSLVRGAIGGLGEDLLNLADERHAMVAP